MQETMQDVENKEETLPEEGAGSEQQEVIQGQVDEDPGLEVVGEGGPRQESESDHIARLEEEIKSYKEQLLRSRADLENVRRRHEREKQDMVKYGNRELIMQLLQVLDNFERAVVSAPESKDPFVIGVSMIQKQLEDVMTQNGLSEIEAKGLQFDPYLHEAIAREETDEHEDNTVIEVFQRGYKLNGQLLRPAQVKVAHSPKDESVDQEV